MHNNESVICIPKLNYNLTELITYNCFELAEIKKKNIYFQP